MIVGVLLAAGAASRFGGGKLVATLPDGTPVGAAAARSMRSAVDRAVAVVRPGDPALAALLESEGFEPLPFARADEGMGAMAKAPSGVDLAVSLNVLGITGMTAYFGLLDVGRLKEGDTVVVSGAAGATGSSVGQIARIKGAGRIVGIAGGPAKCTQLVEELGFDAAIDYREGNVSRQLRELCPKGIDLFFDNVGGTILDAALANLAMRGRVVLCGAIAGYNDKSAAPGPANLTSLIIRRGSMEGFIILDYLGRWPEAQAEMAEWLAEGRLAHAEHIVDGLEHAPDALNLLFTGGNTGKVLVKVS